MRLLFTASKLVYRKMAIAANNLLNFRLSNLSSMLEANFVRLARKILKASAPVSLRTAIMSYQLYWMSRLSVRILKMMGRL